MICFKIHQIPWKSVFFASVFTSAFELLYLEYSFQLYLESFSHFLGIDVFLFYYGNYPDEVGKEFSIMHYAMVLLPFVILFYFVTSDVYTNTCEMMYYTLLRRKQIWKQMYMDLKRIACLICLWQLTFNVIIYIFLSYIYGWKGTSYFGEISLDAFNWWVRVVGFTFKQICILCIVSIVLYFAILVLNEFWGIICIISLTAIKLFSEFGKNDGNYGLTTISWDFKSSLFFLICVLIFLYTKRQKIVKIYLNKN